MIHCHSPNDIYNSRNFPYWIISAFKAGYINSAGFLLTGEFVSHITGFGTRVGITMGHQGYIFGIELLIIPAAFIMGGVITSLVLDRRQDDHIPRYYIVQGLITFLLAVITAFGESDLINDQLPFGADERYTLPEFTVITLLVFVCGLKNSLVAWTTFGKIRVTHLTGLATDIGLNLIRTINKDYPNHRFKESRKINFLRISILLTFSIGAFVSAILFPKLGYSSFFFVFLISLGMTIASVRDFRSLRDEGEHFEPV